MNENNTATDMGTQTETVIEPTVEEQVYTCECCGEVSATANDGVVTAEVNGKTKIVGATMWAAAGEVGSETKLNVYCKKCANEGKDDGQVFFPLVNALRYAERVVKHFPKRERLLDQQYEPEMRVPRPEMVCERCGKAHGQISNFRGDVTIVRGASHINFDVTPIVAKLFCGDCLKVLGIKPNSDKLYRPWKTFVMAQDAEKKRLEWLERKEADKARRAEQRARDKELRESFTASKPGLTTKVIQRPTPAAKPGQGTISHHANRKAG